MRAQWGSIGNRFRLPSWDTAFAASLGEQMSGTMCPWVAETSITLRTEPSNPIERIWP